MAAVLLSVLGACALPGSALGKDKDFCAIRTDHPKCVEKPAPEGQGIDAPPVVDAGGDLEAEAEVEVALDGAVTDDSDAAPSTRWSADAGGCTFGDPAAVDTVVNCVTDGSFTLTLTADDGVNPPVADTTTMSVVPPPDPDPTAEPEPTPDPEPDPTATPLGDGCPTNGPQIALSDTQTAQYKEREIASDTSFDATAASWVGVDDYPVRIGGGAGICWQGGHLEGTYPDTDSWDRLHDTAAFSIESPAFTVLDLRIHNYGDGVNLKDDAADFVVRRAHLSFVRDDCIENDYVNSGVLEDSLLDGCYTGLSARPSSSNTWSDGSGNEWMIRRSLIRLQPMPTVYKGDAPGHGKFFKWDKDGRGPTVSLHGNVFRADQPPNGSDLSVPAEYLGSCSDNVMVWLGEGDYPGWLPDCFTLTRDRRTWDTAVAEWMEQHGG